MPDERQFAHAFQTGAVAVATLVAECAIVYGCFRPGVAWPVPLIAHLTVTAGLAVWCRWSTGLRADVRLPLLLAVGTGALGPIGAAGTLVTMSLACWYMRNAVPFEEWYESLFPETRQGADEELVGRLGSADLSKPGSLTPFADVLAFGTFHQKLALIALINQEFRPAFGPILKRALTDDNNAIRVQAATAMNKLENAILERTIELGRRVDHDPADVNALRALARHFDEYLYSGVLDTRREEGVRGSALEVYRQCIAAAPGDLDLRLAAGRLLLRGKRYAEAADWLEQAMKDGLSTPQADLWYMESLYHLGHFEQLREFARRRQESLKALNDIAPAALDAVRLWGSQGALSPAGGVTQP